MIAQTSHLPSGSLSRAPCTSVNDHYDGPLLNLNTTTTCRLTRISAPAPQGGYTRSLTAGVPILTPVYSGLPEPLTDTRWCKNPCARREQDCIRSPHAADTESFALSSPPPPGSWVQGYIRSQERRVDQDRTMTGVTTVGGSGMATSVSCFGQTAHTRNTSTSWMKMPRK